MWHNVVNVVSIDEVLAILNQKKEKARIIAGATDLILEIERGVRKGIETLVDVSRIPGGDQILLDEDGWVHLGPLVTHNHCVASKLLREVAFPLVQAAWEVGSPQIRNRGTIAGNLVTASPANDTITPLMALGARLVVKSARGERIIPLEKFYLGVRAVDLEPDEMVVDIAFPAMRSNQRGSFLKFALRRAQAISLVNVAVVMTLRDNLIESPSITLGAVAPTIIHAVEAEKFLVGKQLSEDVIKQAGELATLAARPISDVRGSSGYRRRMTAVVTRRALLAILNGQERSNFPENPVLLWGTDTYPIRPLNEFIDHSQQTPISTRINGVQYQFNSGHDKTLLRLLREEANLIGSKEGCAEGECGACTVFLDGLAVMSCMVPATRAHGADIVTIEGLANADRLHPVQQAFIQDGAVQCGYCTPGFIMSAVKLLEERPTPSQEEIKHAITGNLCRCTGYYKIIEAIEHAALLENGRE
jgi:xanthine dehydrogenase iron-sulfur cluster and FAD-binding subunit A